MVENNYSNHKSHLDVRHSLASVILSNMIMNLIWS